MKSIVLTGDRKAEVREISEPVPGADEALVEVAACGICGSEMGEYNAAGPREGRPGHEAAGVVAVADRGGLLKAGDRVVLNVVCGCGECEHCRSGHENFCPDRAAKGRPCRPAGHAAKIAYVARNCLKVPDAMSFEAAIAVGGCGLGVAWHGVKMLDVREGEPVAVIGAGPIGLSAVLSLRYLKAKPIAVDVSDYRLELARKLGADGTVRNDASPAAAPAVEILKAAKLTKSVLCTGNHEAAKLGLACLAPTGKMLILGGLSKWPLDSWQMMGVGDKAILGSWHYHRAEWPEMLRIVDEGLPVGELVTHVFPFDRADEAYRAFAQGETGKVILKP